MHTKTRRAALAAGAITAALAIAPATSSALTQQEIDTFTNQMETVLVAKAKQVLGNTASPLSLVGGDGFALDPAEEMTARVEHPEQGDGSLDGLTALFADTTGALPVQVGVDFSARDANSDAQLPTSSVRISTQGVVPEARRLMFAPKLLPANRAAVASDTLRRSVRANVHLTMDLPPLEELMQQLAPGLGLPVPDSVPELIDLVFGHLLPVQGFSKATGTTAASPALTSALNSLCKLLPPADPLFCGETGDPVPSPTDLQQLLDALKAVDVDAALTEITKLVSKLVDVAPLPVPSISAWFRHRNQAAIEAGAQFCDDGFALLMVPPGTPNVDTFVGTLGTLKSTLEKLVGLGGITSGMKNQLGDLISFVDAIPAVRVSDHNIPNLNTFEMVGGGACTFYNDIEAEDEISSVMTFGLPGAKWRAFYKRDYSLGNGAFDIDTGNSLVRDVNSLHFNHPSSITPISHAVDDDVFGDELSSIQLMTDAQPKLSLSL